MDTRLAAFLVRYRLPVALLSLLLVALVAFGASRLWFESSYKIFFSHDDPRLVAYEDMEAAYTRADNVVFVLAPADGQVFTGPTLDAVEWLTAQAWQLPRSIRVDSISNFQYSHAEDDDLIVHDLVREPLQLDDAQLAELRPPRLPALAACLQPLRLAQQLGHSLAAAVPPDWNTENQVV